MKALALDSSLMTWKDEVMTAINKLVIQSIMIMIPAQKNRAAGRKSELTV